MKNRDFFHLLHLIRRRIKREGSVLILNAVSEGDIGAFCENVRFSKDFQDLEDGPEFLDNFYLKLYLLWT